MGIWRIPKPGYGLGQYFIEERNLVLFSMRDRGKERCSEKREKRRRNRKKIGWETGGRVYKALHGIVQIVMDSQACDRHQWFCKGYGL